VVRLSDGGIPVYPAIALAPVIVAVLALVLSPLALRLRGGEFAIGMWVFAELSHLLVNLDSLIQGETGRSLLAISAFAPDVRRANNYWFALGAMTIFLALVFVLLRSRAGASVQAIRDNEEAAASVGVRVMSTKRIIFVLAATLITFQPKTFFSVQWTAYMIFMTLVGGLGTFEGPIVGAVVFFIVESLFGGSGVWYLVTLGATALVFSLWVPRGIWGTLSARSGLQLMPIGYRLVFGDKRAAEENAQA
jgi:branched-chain amino acid transport system permease protein